MTILSRQVTAVVQLFDGDIRDSFGAWVKEVVGKLQSGWACSGFADEDGPTVTGRRLLGNTVGQHAIFAGIINEIAGDEGIVERRVIGFLAVVEPQKSAVVFRNLPNPVRVAIAEVGDDIVRN